MLADPFFTTRFKNINFVGFNIRCIISDMSYKNTFLAVFIIMGFLTPSLVPIDASTKVDATLSAEQRRELLNKLSSQVTELQAQLQEMIKVEISEKAQLEIVRKDEVLSIKTPTPADYTKGDAKARVQIVTYMDLECPFCKMLHTTLDTILKKNPEVSITYRHFPLVELHPNAEKLAIATECAGQIGGDKAFFSVVDSIFKSRSNDSTTNMGKVSSFIKKAGVSKSAQAKCVKSKAAKEAVEADLAEGEDLGVQGTPQSYVYLDGIYVSEIQGAQPLSVIEDMVKDLVKKK